MEGIGIYDKRMDNPNVDKPHPKLTSELLGENNDQDYAWSCECGSVNFALRKDHKIECNKCGKLTTFNWLQK